jgi:biopolymer transport protein ExbB
MLLLQVSTAISDSAAKAATAAGAPPPHMNLFDLLLSGGWIMVPLGILSVLTIYFIIERYLAISQAAKVDSSFINNIRSMLLDGKMESALSLCKSNNTPIARLLEKGIKRLGRPIKEIESAVENTGRLEIYKLEKNMAYLGIIAAIAPMLGFVGTISGVIKIFYNISLADNISIGLIAGGLYEKMITSASGLVVGIIAHIGFQYLNAMIDRVSYQIETTAVDFIDLIQEPTNSK